MRFFNENRKTRLVVSYLNKEYNRWSLTSTIIGIYMPQPINERFEPKSPPPAPKQPPNKGK